MVKRYDVVTITAGGSTYSHTVTETNSLAQIATFLSLKISNTLVSSSANSNYIDIRTKSVGGLINYTGTVSSASITLSIDDRSTEFSTTTIVDNFKSNYVFSWSAAGNPSYTNNNLEIGSLPADAYTLTVSIDGLTGCSTTAGPFLIEEPSVNIGTVSETCGGTISIPISGSFTSDQMSATGNILTVNLYQGTAGAAPSYSLFDTEAYAVGSLSKTFTVTPLFTGLTPGLNYRVEVLNNTCSTPDTKNFGPISAVLEKHKHIYILSDDIYEHVTYEGFKFFTIAQIESLKDRVLTMNGVSKAYSMTGWRIGYAAGPKDIVKAIAKIQSQSTTNPSSISQAASVEALSGTQDFIKKRADSFQKRRDFVVKALNDIDGINCLNPDGAFYVFPSCKELMGKKDPSGKEIKSDTDFVQSLLENSGIAVVQGSAFGLEGFFRISYATSMENLKKALEKISSFCKSLT